MASIRISRILAALFLLLGVLFLPFWLTLVLGVGMMIYFSFFVEAMALFLISDFLFGVPTTKFFGITYFSFLTAALLFAIIEFVKTRLR